MGLSSAEDESMAAAAAVKATFQAMSSARTGRECAQSTRLRCSCSAAISCTSIEGPRRPDVLGNVEHEDGAGVRPVRAPPLQLQRRRLAHQHRGTAPPRRAPRGDSASSLKEEGKTHRWSGLMGLSSAEDESMAAAVAAKATFQAMSSARTGRECAQSTRLRCSCSAAISCTSIEGPRRPAARPMSAARRLRLATEGGLEAWLPKLAASARRLGCGDGGHSSGSSGHGDVGRQVCCRGMAAGVRGGRGSSRIQHERAGDWTGRDGRVPVALRRWQSRTRSRCCAQVADACTAQGPAGRHHGVTCLQGASAHCPRPPAYLSPPAAAAANAATCTPARRGRRERRDLHSRPPSSPHPAIQPASRNCHSQIPSSASINALLLDPVIRCESPFSSPSRFRRRRGPLAGADLSQARHGGTQ
ncbi:hypothetical protein ZEAMMB73_Zm00001d008704 [Zea mays]|uniref:Uncharacterized protein n=1 Tax=Zea mays TaxID=4577 RepID=A0A1D6FET2_MAIZE|nr:hypothetical protein ZEAMMB73_Zm00001d008704 [Zea mays]